MGLGIKGETVILVEETITGKDAFGRDIVATAQTSVANVIIGNPGTEAAAEELDLTGKRIVFVLGIPKGDTHDWKDKTVFIRGEKFRTYGYPLTQTEANVPGSWNTQVKVEAYE